MTYAPITTAEWRQAAIFWADARKRGLPTASQDALDADVILVASAATIGPQLPEAFGMDIVVGIVWARLGTPLPLDKARPDGRRYESGTIYELSTAHEDPNGMKTERAERARYPESKPAEKK
jgi:hypothetical protein